MWRYSEAPAYIVKDQCEGGIVPKQHTIFIGEIICFYGISSYVLSFYLIIFEEDDVFNMIALCHPKMYIIYKVSRWKGKNKMWKITTFIIKIALCFMLFWLITDIKVKFDNVHLYFSYGHPYHCNVYGCHVVVNSVCYPSHILYSIIPKWIIFMIRTIQIYLFILWEIRLGKNLVFSHQYK